MTQDLHLYASEYGATTETTTIPINIAMYEPGIDYLLVFINGTLAVEDVDYTENVGQGTITLAKPLELGESVNFLCFKADGIEIDTSEFGNPQSRNEALLQNMLGAQNSILYPFSRIEVLLLALLNKMNVDASDNANVAAALENIKLRWSTFTAGQITNVPNVPSKGPVSAVIVYKYNEDYGAVIIISYHPMFPHPAYCRLFAGEWETPYWL